MSKKNLKPKHDKFQSLGPTHSSLVSCHLLSSKAFISFQSLNVSHSLKTSGFQYYGNLTDLITIPASTEVLSISDLGVVNYKLYATELVNAYDIGYLGRIEPDEAVGVHDYSIVGYTVQAVEEFGIADESTSSQLGSDVVPVLDNSFISYIVYANETFGVGDLYDGFQFQDVIDSVKIECCVSNLVDDSVKVEVSSKQDITDSVTIGIKPETYAAVTGINGASYAIPNNPIVIRSDDPSPTQLPIPGDVSVYTESNPWQPTIILDGNVYASAVTTSPPTYGPQTNFIQWLDIDLPGGNNSSNVFDFSFSLNDEGGYFSILSQNPIGLKGEEITIFGLKGMISRTGYRSSDSSKGFITRGIFGSVNLNKEFNIITYGNQYYINYVGSQVLYPYIVSPDQQMSVWDMCRNIAIASNVHMGFYVVDSPYTDVLGQSGQTGLQALSSLASQVGAKLRWTGNNQYSIVYPNESRGQFIVPGPSLITADGIEYEEILDLGLGVTGTGVLQIPKANFFDTDTNSTPFGDTIPTIIDILYPIKSAIESGSPPLKVPLPAETNSAKIQILVNDTNGTGSATGPGAGWITQNESIWFDLGTPSLSNPYVKLSDSNLSYKPYVQITSDMFPNIDAINNDEFVMNIGVERRSLQPNYEDQVEDEQKRLKDLINRMLANLRFIKTYEGSISCFFYGVIPLPGMWASATNICGDTVEGIIESVNFSAPGILTIQVAQYLRINFLDAKSNYVSNPLNQVI